jgi:hypothetical protein
MSVRAERRRAQRAAATHRQLEMRSHAMGRRHRHLRGERVLYREDGGTMTESALRESLARAVRRANLRGTGPHILRQRSARTWRCVARCRVRSRSSPGIGISGRLNATCT